MKISFHSGGCHDSCCLRVQNVSVNIGKDSVLRDVNLHVHCGQMVALIGPNGAGKSTLLKALLGQRDYEGVIVFSVPGQRRVKARIGYVPQSPTFDPGDPISVSDLFACCLSKRPAFLGLGSNLRDQVLECLERVHGEDLIDKRVGTLSGGELQRVLLALALHPAPDLLVLDEPVSGVDQNGLRMFLDTVLRLKETHHMAILLVSHDLHLVREYADHVVLLDKTVLAQGSAENVFLTEQFDAVFGQGTEAL